MMKKLIGSIATTAALTAGLTLGAAAPAGALGPCNNGTVNVADVTEGATGALYAENHIVPTTLGNDAHKPGSHGGFSKCLGTGRNSHKP